MERQPHVTMADLAAACGVSKATVSKALTNHQFRCDIAAETVSRIRALAESMGYRPDWRSATPDRRLTIALVFDTRWGAPFFSGVYEHLPGLLANRLTEQDHDLLLVPLASAARWKDVARSRCLDACVVMQPAPQGLEEILARDRWRAVAFNRSSHHPIDQVQADDAGGIRAAVDHLALLGHRRLAYLDTPAQAHDSATTRREAFLAGCAAGGIDGVVLGQGSTPGDVPEDLVQLRATASVAVAAVRAGRTGLIAYSHRETVAFLRAAHAEGLRLPRDCSVVCGDDCGALEHAVVPVTAIRIPIDDMVDEMVRLVCEDRPVGTPARVVRLPEQLVVRASSGPAP